MQYRHFFYIATVILALAACKGEPHADTQTPDSGSETEGETEVEQTPDEIDLSSGECPHSGSIAYRINAPDSWPGDTLERITKAMDEAIWYYNCYADLSHSLTVNYKASVPTAEANVDGWMSFGNNPSYMVVATAMHEISHTMGVGYYPWTELTDANKRWTGEAVKQVIENIPEEQRDPDARSYITADGLHFWPYGLNYASEHHSEWSLINHVRIVAAMQEDKKNH